jgi:hypothetical protein
MASNGQVWAVPSATGGVPVTGSSGSVALSSFFGGTTTNYSLTAPVYTGNPVSSPLWNGLPPGYCAVVGFYNNVGTLLGITIAVADSSGQMRCPLLLGTSISARSSSYGELACIGSGHVLAVCNGGASWYTIHT